MTFNKLMFVCIGINGGGKTNDASSFHVRSVLYKTRFKIRLNPENKTLQKKGKIMFRKLILQEMDWYSPRFSFGMRGVPQDSKRGPHLNVLCFKKDKMLKHFEV